MSACIEVKLLASRNLYLPREQCGSGRLTRTLKSLLFGVSAIDAPTFATAVGVLIVLTLMASYVPARRATRIDPANALRTM
jgi:ABC-type antimicrobial peptide transport system permease subunit